MTNTKSTKRALLMSGLAILLCLSMFVGSTFAWFTDSVTSDGNVIKSGKLEIAMSWAEGKEDPASVTWKDASTNAIFNYDLWEPGYVEVRHIKIENVGTLALKYKLQIIPTGEVSKLADVIDVYYVDPATQVTDRTALTDSMKLGTLTEVLEGMENTAEGNLLAGENHTITLALKMQESADNEYQNLSIGSDFSVVLLATQLTSETDSFDDQYDAGAEYDKLADKWDGTADTTWYNDTDTEFTLNSAEQLAGLAKLVDEGNNFSGKTVKLASDADLYMLGANGEPVSFDPIGDKSPFSGTFDGDGHTISNLYQSGWAFGYEWGAYGSIGLFGELENATVKNLTIAGAESLVEGGDVGGVAGSASGTCVFENITIKDSDFATYNNGNGGIIGWSGAGNYTFKNIKIAEDVTLAGLWGSFDSSIGGIVGQAESGATYNFENVEVSCRIDAYNDCTASYDYYNYRMCGMLIGRCEETTTIDGANYPDLSKYNITFTDVTVNYGEWMNYHYCEPTPGLNGGRGMRVEAGYAYDGLPADYDHSQCVDNCMNLIPFDQLIGGDQIAVKGLKTVDGVTVNYPTAP